MWRADENIFWNIGESSIDVPARQAHKESGDIMKPGTQNGSIENCHWGN
jgi:hypothetical protein